MAKPEVAKTEADKQPPAPPAKRALPTLLVLDPTAIVTAENPTGERTHVMIVEGAQKPFTFKPAQPYRMPASVAIKFFAAGFLWCDEQGQIKPFPRRPKQPDELEAGEKLEMADDQTIAKLDELSTTALQTRALELPGSDHFAENPSRAALIKFLKDFTVQRREQNKSSKPDIAKDEFDPLAMDEFEDEAA